MYHIPEYALFNENQHEYTYHDYHGNEPKPRSFTGYVFKRLFPVSEIFKNRYQEKEGYWKHIFIDRAEEKFYLAPQVIKAQFRDMGKRFKIKKPWDGQKSYCYDHKGQFSDILFFKVKDQVMDKNSSGDR